MEPLLTVKEAAALKGCSERYIQAKVKDGSIPHELGQTRNGRPQYLIPISGLDPAIQRRYYRQRGDPLPEHLARERLAAEPDRPKKTLDQFTLDQREEIEFWINLLRLWQEARAKGKSKAEADKAFVAESCAAYGEKYRISRDILYRKWAAYQADDLEGLIDRRGSWKKGTSSVPQEIKDIFMYTWLDDRALPVKKCMEATTLILQQERPELLEHLPSYDTFYRWSRECPMPLSVLARKGEKAFNDRCGVYVNRLYDNMMSNDYWIADGHTFDVISVMEDGSERTHRLTLSAFIDARSGIFVGWVVTDHPSSDATLLALRKAIKRYGIPKNIYVDNGREYLNIDIGGTGHRTRKRKVEIQLPTPILTRLGIQMTNALPRNAQAKIIERAFRDIVFLSQLFETYCGSNPSMRPEKLKYYIKQGRIPTDSELAGVVEDMLEGYFNDQPYNGKVVRDRGKTRMEVYNQYRQGQAIRMASEEDLALMMMRSTRLQTVGRNGVYLTIGGERLYYYNDALMLKQGQKVFVRYDPEVMNEVRVYDENEQYMLTAPLAEKLILEYGASKADLSAAMAEKRRWRKKIKDEINVHREAIVSQYGHINMRDLFVRAARINRGGLLAPAPANVIQIVTPPKDHDLAAVSGGESVTIDRARIIRNAEKENR